MASIGDTTRPEYIYDQATDTWIPVGIGPHSHTPAAIGAISSSVVTTKGDLIVATGSGTVVRQGVGADGSMLVADSSQTDGVSYALGNAYAAGKNKIINGDMGVWQRGTSFNNPSSGTYTADRWQANYSGSGATRTISRQTFTPGTAPVAGYEGTYFLRYDQSVAGSGGFYNQLFQPVEDVRTFAGQTVTFSFWAKASASVTMPYIAFEQYFGSGGSGDVGLTFSTSTTITTSWVRYTFTGTVPSIAGKTIGTNSYLKVVLGVPTNATFTIDFWGVQVEAGSVATPFQTATGTIQGELAACQRYLPATTPSDAIGYAYNNNATIYSINYPVTPRVAPTGITTTGSFNAYASNTAYAVTISINTGGVTQGSVTASGITIGVGLGSRLTQNAAGTILWTGCEL